MRKRLTDRLEKTAASGGLRRQIPDDFRYNPKKLKHLKAVLHKLNDALGDMVSAQKGFSRVKGPDISPDGHLGGFGYILPIKDIKQEMHQMIQKISDIADCIADELTNPKWNAKDDKEVKELIKEKKVIDEEVNEEVSPDAPPDEIDPDDVQTGPSDDDSQTGPGPEIQPVYEEEEAQEPIQKEASNGDKVGKVLASEIKKALLKFRK
jgi:hypothetical protein